MQFTRAAYAAAKSEENATARIGNSNLAGLLGAARALPCRPWMSFTHIHSKLFFAPGNPKKTTNTVPLRHQISDLTAGKIGKALQI
jgi:hypothetical protein